MTEHKYSIEVPRAQVNQLLLDLGNAVSYPIALFERYDSKMIDTSTINAVCSEEDILLYTIKYNAKCFRMIY